MNKNLLVVTFISFVNAMSISLVIPIVYIYAKEYGISDFAASLLLVAYSLTQFIATPIIGRLSDYFGRKPLLAASLFGTFVGNILTAMAPSAGFLFIARAVDGITGGNNSVAQSVISDTTTPAERAKGFGLFGASFAVAFVLGPIISLALQSVSLNAPYIAAAILALIACIMSVVLLDETLKVKETKKITLGSLGFQQIVTGLFIPKLGVLFILNFMANLIFGIFVFGFQPFLLNVFNASVQQITMVIIAFGIVSVIMQSFLIKKLSDRFGDVNVLKGSLILTAICLFLQVLAPSYIVILLLVIPFAAASAVLRPILTSLISINSRPEDQGISLGIAESYFSLANTVGPLLGGVVVVASAGAPLVLSSAVAILTFIMLILIAPRLKEKNQAANF